jgi:hypothetical protein
LGELEVVGLPPDIVRNASLVSEEKMKNDSSKAIYLYCLTHSGHLRPIEGPGVDGKNPLFLHEFLEIVAVVSTVSLDEFCGSSAESRLQDLSWVGPRACRHEEVIEQVMRYSPVLPARFGTLFSSLDSLDKLLQKHHDAILRFLGCVADKEEWSVKVLLDRATAKWERLSKVLSNESGRHASLPPGMRYIQEQRIRADIEKELSGWLEGVCRKIANDLSNYPADFCQRRILAHGTTRSDGDMVRNWAFLIPRSAVPDFQTRIREVNANYFPQGLVFELSGPWPPYSFSLSIEGEPES